MLNSEGFSLCAQMYANKRQRAQYYQENRRRIHAANAHLIVGSGKHHRDNGTWHIMESAQSSPHRATVRRTVAFSRLSPISVQKKNRYQKVSVLFYWVDDGT